MQLYKRARLWADTLIAFLFSFGGSGANIDVPEKTVERILKGRSLIRFGDGEFGIFHGRGIHYQEWSPELLYSFEKIKHDYISSPDTCPYILAVPRSFLKCSGFQLLKKRVYVASWARSRWDFIRCFPQNIPYGEAFLFEKGNKDIYRAIWYRDVGKHIVFVHNSMKYAEQFSRTYRREVEFVKCPSENAFAACEDIENRILEKVSYQRWAPENVMVVISAGPAGKVISYDLCRRGYQCIDTGHCWDDPLEGME